MDIFCEYLVKHKKSLKDSLLSVLIAILAVILTGVVVLFAYRYVRSFTILLIVAIWYFAVKLMQRTDLEYEYILTNNNLDIDRIVAKNSRKRLISIDFSQIDDCSYFDEAIPQTSGSSKIHDFTGEGKRVYCVTFSGGGVKNRVFFEPSDKILLNLKSANPRTVHVRPEDINNLTVL